jgi:hypothetical protein
LNIHNKTFFKWEGEQHSSLQGALSMQNNPEQSLGCAAKEKPAVGARHHREELQIVPVLFPRLKSPLRFDRICR